MFIKKLLCITPDCPTPGDPRHRSALERYVPTYVDLSLLSPPVRTGQDTETRDKLVRVRRKIHKLYREARNLDDCFHCGELLKKDLRNLKRQSDRLDEWMRFNISPTSDEIKTMKDAVHMVSRNINLVKQRYVGVNPDEARNPVCVIDLNHRILLEAITGQSPSPVLLSPHTSSSITTHRSSSVMQTVPSSTARPVRSSVYSSSGGEEGPPPYQERDPNEDNHINCNLENTDLCTRGENSRDDTEEGRRGSQQEEGRVDRSRPGSGQEEIHAPIYERSPASPLSRLPGNIGLNTTEPPPLGLEAPPSYEDATSTTV